VLAGAKSADPAVRSVALESLMAVYWRPVHRHIRSRWPVADEAEDLTQGFFAAVLEKGWLRRFDPARGRFRSYLLACLGLVLAYLVMRAVLLLTARI
jgi:RNA polymerase sigma-70 factor (ECF subfamily)